MELVKSRAEFLDGPLRGQVREFDRDEPPPKYYMSDGFRTKDLTYIRDDNPFEDGEKWIYVLDFERYPEF